MTIRNVTDLDIQALVDGEVTDEESAYLMEILDRDPALYHRYLLYKKQKSLLKVWWKDN